MLFVVTALIASKYILFNITNIKFSEFPVNVKLRAIYVNTDRKFYFWFMLVFFVKESICWTFPS